MNRDKQIEEMARDICECFNNDGTCYQDDKPCDCKCESFTDAQYLYNAGYRKASDVARELIDDIIEALQGEIDAEDKLETTAWNESDTVGYHIHQYAEDKLDTLKIAFSLYKKKYESEGEG